MNRILRNGILIALLAASGVAGYYWLSVPPKMTALPDLTGRQNSATPEFLNAQRSVEFYRGKIQNSPDDATNYVRLARVYLQEARVTGLHHVYAPAAKALLDAALLRSPGDVEALVTLASMEATLHQFERAEFHARKARAINPHNSAALGILVDCAVEMGQYENAVRLCDSLIALRPDLASYSRAAYLRELHGDINGAEEVMKLAAEAGVTGQEDRAWTLSQLAHLYLQKGKVDTAEFLFKGILEERPGYAFALSGLSRVAQARTQYAEAIDYLHQAFASVPDHGFAEQLCDLYRVTGQNDSLKKATEFVFAEFRDHQNEGWNIDREFAIFCANHDLDLAQALSRIEREYERRPANIEVLDTYAWVLHKSGRSREAVPVIQKALRLGTKNPSVLYHAAKIHGAAGDAKQASGYMRAALEGLPSMNVLYVEDARREAAGQLALN